MGIPEKINEHLRNLPEVKQAEVLDFVRYLEEKKQKDEIEAEKKAWSSFSLTNAMVGLEEEPEIYSEADIKE